MRAKRLTTALLLVLGYQIAVGYQATRKVPDGTLVGSIAYVDEAEKEFLGDASHVTVILEHKGQTVRLVSDEAGNYVVDLSNGTYCLKSAVSKTLQPLEFSSSQHKCFKIRVGKSTRFDVMLLKSN